ncbi:MAG: hypothetical protein QXG97_03155 [Nitrososphaerota archaeon]
MTITLREFLEMRTYTRDQVDRFLNPDRPNWADFDPELGYKLRHHNVIKDGVDGSRTILNLQPTGERKMINFAGEPCRINTYGDSFTQCCQTSDGETWQEILAAHLGEPVRNFGVGGYGVYQAYRRMLREEVTAQRAEYVILNIYGIDDHLRSLDAWRYLRVFDWFQRPAHVNMFHANPWAYVRINPETGALVEYGNPYPTPESLYKLCDKDHVYETFKDDLIAQMFAAQTGVADVDFSGMKRLAETLQVGVDFTTPRRRRESAKALHIACGLRASMFILKKAQDFCERNGKKLLILLSYDPRCVVEACRGKPRSDQSFVDYLRKNRIRFVDTLTKHLEDFKAFKISPQEYVARYYIGHYSPRGNHFFAFAIKDAIVDWLDPKPLAYREGSETL